VRFTCINSSPLPSNQVKPTRRWCSAPAERLTGRDTETIEWSALSGASAAGTKRTVASSLGSSQCISLQALSAARRS
jgi:hypothetical protein